MIPTPMDSLSQNPPVIPYCLWNKLQISWHGIRSPLQSSLRRPSLSHFPLCARTLSSIKSRCLLRLQSHLPVTSQLLLLLILRLLLEGLCPASSPPPPDSCSLCKLSSCVTRPRKLPGASLSDSSVPSAELFGLYLY